MKLFVLAFLTLASSLAPHASSAHPGRLDAVGCHHVNEDYEYESGKVLKKGTYHCHRTLGQGIRLDGKQLLEDPRDPGITTKERRRLERRDME